MKRILILTILLMSSLAWAGSTTVVVGQGSSGAGGGGASCTTENDSLLIEQTSGATTITVGEEAWAAQGIQFSSTTTITQIDVYIRDNNDAGSFVVQLYTDDGGGKPNEAIADTDVTVAASSIDAGPGLVSFVLATSYELTASTAYHIVMKGTVGSSFSVYDATPSAIADGHENVYAAGWTSYANWDLRLNVYGCQ